MNEKRTFDRKELNDFDLHTGSGELIILDEFGNSKATSRQTSTTSTATTNATGVANQLSRTNMASGEKYKSNEQGKQQQEAAAESSSLEDPFGLDIEVINNHRKSLSINSFSSLSDLKTHQTPPLTKRFAKRLHFFSTHFILTDDTAYLLSINI